MEKKPKSTTPRKTYNVKPKPIHYRLVNNLIENGGNKAQALKDTGYSKAVQSNQNVLKTKGFLQAMNEMGLTDELLVSSLVKDVQNEKRRTVNHLQLGFKLRGHLKEKSNEQKNLVLIVSGESATRYNVREHKE